MAVVVIMDEAPFTYFGWVTDRTGMVVPSEMTPEQYVKFAQEDFASATMRGYINALGNAKRALHLMIDTLLHNYGLLARNRKISFPSRLKILDRCGLISLSIFRKLNVERNAMEHEYRVPSVERVSDAIDVCRLLLLAVKQLCQEVPREGLVGLRSSGTHALFRLNAEAGQVEFTELRNCETSTEDGVEFVIPQLVDGLSRVPTEDMLADEPFLVIPLEETRLPEWCEYISAIAHLRTLLADQRRARSFEYVTIGYHVPWDQSDIPFSDVLKRTWTNLTSKGVPQLESRPPSTRASDSGPAPRPP